MTAATGRPRSSSGTGAHLRAVAYRMLGSLSEADDVLQEAWLRLSRVRRRTRSTNLRGWLTTVVGARLPRHAARPAGAARGLRGRLAAGADRAAPTTRPTPSSEALLADSVGLALLVVLETLTPPERLAFVLHDMFARAVRRDRGRSSGRSPAATRQLASRARRRVRGAAPESGRRPGGAAAGRRRVPRRLARPATSTRSSPCSIPTSSSASTAAACRVAARRPPWSRGAEGVASVDPRARRSVRRVRAAGDRQRCGGARRRPRRRTRSPSSASPSRTAGSSRST